MSNWTVTKGLIGKEDLNTGTGTFTRATSTGGTQTLTKIGGLVPQIANPADFAGADMGAQIAAANTALVAAGGGIIDARGFQGAQTASTGFTVGQTGFGGAAVQLLLGQVVITASAPIVVGTGSSIVGISGTFNPSSNQTGVSVIHGTHTGVAVINLSGSYYVTLRDLDIVGDLTTIPKTGILCGRTSTASAGNHIFTNISVRGSYSKAVIYSIASEVNKWSHIFAALDGGSALYVFFTSQADDLSVNSLTSSTNTTGFIGDGSNLINNVAGAGASCFYMNASGSTADWSVRDAYLTFGAAVSGAGASYVDILVSGNSYGAVTFDNVGGEPDNAVKPDNTYYIHAAGAETLGGLRITGGIAATSTNYFINVPSNVTLQNAEIAPGWASNAASQVFNSQNSKYRLRPGHTLTFLGSSLNDDIQVPTVVFSGGVNGGIVNTPGAVAVGMVPRAGGDLFQVSGGIEIESTGTNFAHIISTPTAARQWTIPDATDTFVGLAAAQTLTAKTLTGEKHTVTSISSSGGTTNCDLSLGSVFQTPALTENTALAFIGGLVAGRLVTFVIVQNAASAKTWTWPASVHGGMTISATLSSINTQQFIVSSNGTDLYPITAGATGTVGGTP